MHAAFARDGGTPARESHFRVSFPSASPAIDRVEVPLPPDRYGESDRPNWLAIAAILAVHVLLLIVLVKMDVIAIGKPAPVPLVIDLMTEPTAPPPVVLEPQVQQAKAVQPVIVAPPPIVQAPAPPPPPVAVVAAAPPPQAVAVPAAPEAALPGPPVSIDLSTKMVSATAPRYPTESRRRREQGVVVLRLLLGLDGRVSDIAVARSSGFDRLDKAALEAVRRWRWSPTMQAGEAVQVRGMVEIPFVLQG